MRLLISAYACAPHQGSEHAVGWNWVTEAQRQGHSVCVLTSCCHREAIEAACSQDVNLCAIEWLFPKVSAWPLQPGTEPRFERTYNLLWQFVATKCAKQRNAIRRFDALHHLTWGGLRAPTFLGGLDVPLIIGPVGGGEASPKLLRAGLTIRAKLTEKLRDISNATFAINPIVCAGFAKAAIIFARTPETQRTLPDNWQRKTRLFSELTLQPADIGSPRRSSQSAPRILCTGRLLYWKGVHLAVRAFAEIVKHEPRARLTILGDGPENTRLQARVAALGLADNVEFVPRIPRARMQEVYDAHDLLLFLSLHDSGGTVVVEAMSRGLPVVCLDLGGPAVLVTEKSGIVVSTPGRDNDQVATEVGKQVVSLLTDPVRFSELSRGAVARAQAFLVAERVGSFYRQCAALLSFPVEPPPAQQRAEPSLTLAERLLAEV